MAVDRLTTSLMHKQLKKDMSEINHQEIVNMLEEQGRIARYSSKTFDGNIPDRETIAKWAFQ